MFFGPPGDYQEVPDPVPSASGWEHCEWVIETAEHELDQQQLQHLRRRLRWHLHAQILCLQLTGKPHARFNFALKLKLATLLWCLSVKLIVWSVSFPPQTVYAVPILTFAFVCHPAILPMYEELKEWVLSFHRVHPHWKLQLLSYQHFPRV